MREVDGGWSASNPVLCQSEFNEVAFISHLDNDQVK